MKWFVSAATLLACALSAPAEAATLVNSGGRLTYVASGAKPVHVSFQYGRVGYVTVYKQSSDTDTITATGCSVEPGSFPVYQCPGVVAVTATGGSGDDYFDGQELQVPLTANGGAGEDVFRGGEGADVFSGGDGEDFLAGETGDTLSGGAGLDSVTYTPPSGQLGPVTITLDGIADDGVADDHVNLLADIEDVDADGRFEFGDPLPTYGRVTLVGTDAGNHLTGSSGPDTITGGGGIDVLEGEDGDDTLLARDGVADRVRCGAGTDTAAVDPFDQVSDTCEVVQVVGASSQDAPPTIAWKPGSPLGVLAGDDHGIVRVQWIDDDRVICTATTAPFDCDFRPRVEDVGRNTITAIATDTVGQTASLTTAKTVAPFRPIRISLKVKRSGHRYVASGTVTLPSGVPCSGSVAVGSRTGKLRATCAFRIVVPRATKYVANYLGTDAIAPQRSKAVRPRR